MEKFEWLIQVLYYLSGLLALYVPVFHKTNNESSATDGTYLKHLPRFTGWGWTFFVSAIIYVFCSWGVQNISSNKEETKRKIEERQNNFKDSINSVQQSLRDRKIDSLKILISIIESEYKTKLALEDASSRVLRRGNIHKLLSASNNLLNTRSEYMSSFFNSNDKGSQLERNISFLKKSKNIIDSQLDNPFLLENTPLYNEWFHASTGIVVYLGGASMPKQAEGWDKLYNQLDSGLFYVFSKTNSYCWNTLNP